MSKMHSTSLLSTPWPFWTGIFSQVSKNDDEKTLLLIVIWLYMVAYLHKNIAGLALFFVHTTVRTKACVQSSDFSR